jgi:serine/threonine protein kinase
VIPIDEDDAAAPTAADTARSAAERRIGPYRLVRRIGRGGMGTVYLAIRDDEAFQRRVAVKVLKRGMDTPSGKRQAQGDAQFHVRGVRGRQQGRGLYATFARDGRSPTRPADLLAAERDYQESVDVLSALQRASAIEGTDLTSLDDARRQLATVRHELAEPPR